MAFTLTPLWISLKIAVIATIITFLLGVATAYGMSHYRGKGKTFIEATLLAPLFLPPTALGFLLLLLLGKTGPLGQGLAALNISLVFTWYAAVLAATLVSFPLMYKTTLGAFEQLPRNLPQVARTLGASEWQVFAKICLPLAGPGIVAGTSLAFARAVGEFGATLMVAGNIPSQTQTLPMALYFAVERGAFTEAMAWCFLTFGLALFSLLVMSWGQGPSRHRHQQHFSLAQAGLGLDFDWKNDQPNVKQTQASTEQGLIVELYKQLPGFCLDIALSSKDTTLGILGASGAGKTMLLRCIAGIEAPDRGRIVLNGRVLFDADQGINVPSRDRKIALLFQDYALFPHLTATQNVAFGLPTHSSGPSRNVTAQRQLAAVHLSGHGDRYPHQLSGGQQQRVALARALASQPELLLLDEPFAALDTHLKSQIEQRMGSRLAAYRGQAIWVTHNVEEAYRVCDQLLILEQGHILQWGSKHQILSAPQTVSVAQLTGCKNISRAIATGPHHLTALDWHCSLQTAQPLPQNLAQVGIRAHQIRFLEGDFDRLSAKLPNLLPCWLAMTRETPHRMTLYLKLHAPPSHAEDYHLQAEVLKDLWEFHQTLPLPWLIQLDPHRLLLLSPY